MGKKDVYEVNRINPRGDGYFTFIGLILKCLAFILLICIVMMLISHFIRAHKNSETKIGANENWINAAKSKTGENMNSESTESVTVKATVTVASIETTNVELPMASTESTGSEVSVTFVESTTGLTVIATQSTSEEVTDPTNATVTVTSGEATTKASHMDYELSKDLMKTCITKECKQVASELLYVKSHNAEPCENFFNYACEGKELEDSDYFRYTYDEILNLMKKSNEEYLRHFKTFHDSCVEYNSDISLKKRFEPFFSVVQSGLAKNDINAIIIDSILTQSNPFFDISITIGESQKFEYQIFPPDAQTRMQKTNQNFFQRIQEECISENKEDKIIVDSIRRSVKDCIVKNLRKYFDKFANEVEKLNKELSMKFNQTHFELLKDIFKLNSNGTVDKLTVKEFNMSSFYQFGVDWIQVFNGISKKNVSEDSVVAVHTSEYLKEVFEKLQNIENRNIIEMLTFFLGLELYEDVIMYQPSKNIHSHCLKLSSSLMPDVATIAVYNSTEEIDSSPIQSIFNKMKKQLEYSLNQSILPIEYISSSKEKIRNATLFTMNFSSKNYSESNYDGISSYEGVSNFPETYLMFFRNYRKMIYSKAGLEVSPQDLLQYFLSPFSNRPKSFVPSNFIVFHKGFLQKTSTALPKYMSLAQIGFHLGRELLKYIDFKLLEEHGSVWNNISTNTLPRNRQPSTVSIAGKKFKIVYSLDPTEAIIDNGAFRLLTDLYNTSSDLQDLIWLNQSYTKEQVFILTAMQGQCEKDSYTSFMKATLENKLPSFIKMESIVRNSEFLSKQFACTFDADHISQFPHVGLSRNSGVLFN